MNIQCESGGSIVRQFNALMNGETFTVILHDDSLFEVNHEVSDAYLSERMSPDELGYHICQNIRLLFNKHLDYCPSCLSQWNAELAKISKVQ